MTVLSRSFRSVPHRTAAETWSAIVDLIAPKSGQARNELESIAGTACAVIAEEILTDSPIVLRGSGPRVRIYCLFNDAALDGDKASESELPFDATDGDWLLSLPTPELDLKWVRSALKQKSKRITARDKDEPVENSATQTNDKSLTVDKDAFLRL